MPKKILIATQNQGKLKEIQNIYAALPIQIVSTADLGIEMTILEDGQTYYDNALKKAAAFFQASGLVTLADDSGLELASLNGAPGIHSARYAPFNNPSDTDRRRYLLDKLSPIPQPWLARFHCTIVIVDKKGEISSAEGSCNGIIIPEERGDGGFGYDPIFFMPEHNATMAELSSKKKNQISHRARALQAALPHVIRLFHLDNTIMIAE
ncbi:MAG: RdgB/HAM1 family non-canonical purine NTP pyrophosphatase [Chloroflexota bacterium]